MANVFRGRGLCCALVSAVSLCVPVHAAGEWRRIDSPNFIVVGDVGERQLRDTAGQFEGFREVLSQILVEGATATAVPTVVVVFPNERAFRPFKPIYEGKPVDVAGLFYGGRDVNYIALLGDGRPQSLRVLFHEYAHLVTSNLARNLPVWLSEGLAEFYSTYEPRNDHILIGMPIDSHLMLLNEVRQLPLDALLKVQHDSPLYNEGDRRSVFYAQSWALTHMLLMGEPRRTEELKTYLRLTAGGTSETDAWKKAFGAADIERALRQYVTRSSMRAYKFNIPKAARFQGTPRVVADTDARAILAALHLRQQRTTDAEALLSAVLAAQPAHALAGVVMALAEIDRGEYGGATKRVMAIEATDDWFVRYLAGLALAYAVVRDDSNMGAATAAMGHLEAVGAHREVPNALARIADLQLALRDGPLPKARAAIERARALAPGRDDYTFTHARVLGQLGEFAAARATVAPLLHPTNAKDIREGARSLMGYLVNLEAYRKRVAEHPTATGSPAPPSGSGAGSAPSRFIPVYRETRQGEERIEGVLERIECPAKSGPVFHVRAGSSATALKAVAFDAVDFITYRDDLSGNIGCGALKTPMWVYVTLGPGGEPGGKVVVAIEFLPK